MKISPLAPGALPGHRSCRAGGVAAAGAHWLRLGWIHLLRCLQRVRAAWSIRRAAEPPGVQSYPLVATHTWWLTQPRGRTVYCERGRLWLTFDGECVDIVLEAGQAHHCRSNARLGVHAMIDASFIVRCAEPPGRFTPPAAG